MSTYFRVLLYTITKVWTIYVLFRQTSQGDPQLLSATYITQQASVRRGPRASATSLFTVSLAESEASACLPNRVCVSPINIA